VIAEHKNELSTYLADWLAWDRRKVTPPTNALRGTPSPVSALHDNEYDLRLTLDYLDSTLRRLEEVRGVRIDKMAYSESRVFLKSAYIYFRIVLDTLAAIIEAFYKHYEKVHLPSSFHALQSKAKRGDLPTDLSTALISAVRWFPEFRRRRDDLVHHYRSFIILYSKGADGIAVLDHAYAPGAAPPGIQGLGLIREYVGALLRGYQELVNALLDLLDSKSLAWRKLRVSPAGRNSTILEDVSAQMIWWAWKYGGYRHSTLKIHEQGNAT
jgi:hypothetical protein